MPCSKESNVTDSTAEHCSLSALIFSCCVIYQLKNEQLSSLLCKGFNRAGYIVSAPSSLVSPLSGKLDVLAVFHPVSSNCIFPCIFLSPSFSPREFLSRITEKKFQLNLNILLCYVVHKSDCPLTSCL